MKRSGKTRNVVICYSDYLVARCGELHCYEKARSAKQALRIAQSKGCNMVGASVALGEIWGDDDRDDGPYYVTVCQPAPWLNQPTCSEPYAAYIVEISDNDQDYYAGFDGLDEALAYAKGPDVLTWYRNTVNVHAPNARIYAIHVREGKAEERDKGNYDFEPLYFT